MDICFYVTKFIGSGQLNCFIKRFSSEQMIYVLAISQSVIVFFFLSLP
jgi:hypothetical protein